MRRSCRRFFARPSFFVRLSIVVPTLLLCALNLWGQSGEAPFMSALPTLEEQFCRRTHRATTRKYVDRDERSKAKPALIIWLSASTQLRSPTSVLQRLRRKVEVTANQSARVDAALKVEGKGEEIMVVGDRPHGEAEAINRQRTSDNILQVLPSDVIRSLPNANIADAVRLPSVSLERDEGEGKYVQIRGTEPRLNNLTIDTSVCHL